ncbi:MAG: Formate dehydrogenase subunit alpha [Thermacetogenium phaeum]|uniref:Formate dehydrogenase subunit alpha n=1 Tax=Thermacetogenium phaeum TaxID=85874 RepID=A0A117LBB1_9THEO|nr:MAG: Formate dehydrogenase subunit alpha [Thermacetogenium phaeum]
MTNHWVDMRNTDCALIIGSNAAENHPMSFKWLTEAREKRGAKIIHVDPRFTRTSARADIYAPLRSGTDIAFIGGIINYVLQNNLYFHDYVVNYTNAPFIIDDGFDCYDNGVFQGLFTGYDPEKRKYDQSTWKYKTDAEGNPLKDLTLQNPRCVFQLLKKHFERYDVDTVCSITGTPKDLFLKVAETYAATGTGDKSGTILYAMGTTQHTVGSENVRIYAILQLLLGNIGVPGGGVNAMRGESNVQGACDMGLLNHVLTGYIAAPTNDPAYVDLAGYLAKETPKAGFKVNTPKWLKSMLKAWYGDAATLENDFCYDYLPKRQAGRDYSHIGIFEAMYDGEIKGLLCFGSNPFVSGPDAAKETKALEKLDWMVAADLFETETASFWKREAGADPSKIKTEVFFLPAAASYEKSGTITNSGRWIQFRWKAVEPVGEAISDLEIFREIGLKVKEAYQGSTDPKDKPILDMTWDYPEEEAALLDAVQREINGYDLSTGKLMPRFADLRDDGTTSCGVWIYCGMYTEEGNKTQLRSTEDPSGMGVYPNWSYAWPANRRIVYNRCSADPSGKPWSEDKKIVWWDGSSWKGIDVPDFIVKYGPGDPEDKAFIMKDDGVGGLFAKMADGPFPEHYEPWESPVEHPFSPVQFNPVAIIWDTPMNPQGKPDRYPIIGTTYRVVEHWQAGIMTRNTPWLAELMPEAFVELSKELAAEKGIANGDVVTVESARGKVKAVACVTGRFKPFKINGKWYHEIGLVWHYGFQGIAKGDPANRLTPHIGCANSQTPEYKAFLCDIYKGVK